MNHILKTDTEVFAAVRSGTKTYELRLDDRGFNVGDTLLLRETVATGKAMRRGADLAYTGRECSGKVNHILRGPIYGLMDGWIIMSLSDVRAAASLAGAGGGEK